MVAELGGPADFLDRLERHLPAAPVILPVQAREPGRVAAIDVRRVGLAIVALGGGRTRTEDPVDLSVGLSEVAGLGEAVEPDGRPLALVHARDRDHAERARDEICAAFSLAPPEAATPALPPLVAGRIGP
jgi:thymidine phosphorylase